MPRNWLLFQEFTIHCLAIENLLLSSHTGFVSLLVVLKTFTREIDF